MLSALDQVEDTILARQWFYRFVLPSGRTTQLYIPDSVAIIHETRVQMLFGPLDPLLGDAWSQTTCIDLASHQGFSSPDWRGRPSAWWGSTFSSRTWKTRP
jgi:hypothetical protein